MHQNNLFHCQTWLNLYNFCPMKHLKLKMNESVLNEWTNSISMALLEREVYKASYLLTSFQPSFTTNDPKISTPQYVNGSSIMHPIFWQTWYLFFCLNCPLNCLHLAHFQTLIAPMNCILSSKNQKILFGWLWYLNQYLRPWHDTIEWSI